MADATIEITYQHEEHSRIPDNLREGVALLLLWLYYAAGAEQSVKEFWEEFQPHKAKIAALANRSSLASPSSLSRALGSVELDLLRPVATWLLAGVSTIDALMKHPPDRRAAGTPAERDPGAHGPRARQRPRGARPVGSGASPSSPGSAARSCSRTPRSSLACTLRPGIASPTAAASPGAPPRSSA